LVKGSRELEGVVIEVRFSRSEDRWFEKGRARAPSARVRRLEADETARISEAIVAERGKLIAGRTSG